MGCLIESLDVVHSISVMVRKCDAVREADARSFEASKELLGAGYAAESDDRPGDLRNFHASAQSPDGTGPTPGAKVGFEISIVGGDSQDARPLGCVQSFTEIAGRKQVVVPIFATDQQNVDIAMKLSMLKSVIEDVNVPNPLVLLRIHFGK